MKGLTERDLSLRRPVLIHLNADTSWLLSLPYPNDDVRPSRRSRFNILIDPWLQGSQTDVASWFSTQWHRIPSSVQTIEELSGFLQETEDLELQNMKESGTVDGPNGTSTTATTINYIDAVVCSHEFTDHCHEKTLKEIPPSTPCLATTKAAELIRPWKHFQQVFQVPHWTDGSDWRETWASALPPWVGISRLVTESDALHLHSAIAIIFSKQNLQDADNAEAVVYTPHGIRAEEVAMIPAADPPIQTLALIHGLHDVSIFFAKQINLGALNALQCQKTLESKYWVGTHDEIKTARGIIAAVMSRKIYTKEDVLKVQESEVRVSDSVDEQKYIELGSGQSLVLD